MQPPRWIAWAGRGDWPVDLALAGAVTALTVADANVPDASWTYGFRDGGWMEVALAGLAGAALVWRRVRPLASFLVVDGVLVAVLVLQWQFGWLPLVLMFSAYALGAHGSRRGAWAGLGLGLVAMGVPAVWRASDLGGWLAVSLPAEFLLVLAFGRVVAHRRTVAAQAHRHALELARTSGLASEQAVNAERLRVARELHDTVSNQLAVISMNAAARAEESPGREVLARIESEARTSLSDLRRLLGALRQAEDPDDDLARSLARVTGWTRCREPPRKAEDLVAARWPADVALAAAVMAVNLVGSLVPDPHPEVPYREPNLWLFAVLATIPGAALLFRRAHPIAVLAAVFTAYSAVGLLGWQTGTLPGALLIATYAVGAWAPLRRGIAAMVVMGVAAAGVAVLMHAVGSPVFAEWMEPESPLFVYMPFLIGLGVGRRRRAAEAAVERAREAEQAHARAQERAVHEERLRVARDLHDVIAHGLAAIAVEAAVARREHGDRDFWIIDEASHRALDSLREMLGVLRGSTPDEPAPGLTELDALVASHRAAHGPVVLDIDPAVAAESAGLRLTVHRIVQEALTNVGRHAPGASTSVSVELPRDAVEVTITDDGHSLVTSGAGAGSGFGLVGMRERVTLYGGDLQAGPTDDGGFCVRARLPRDATC